MEDPRENGTTSNSDDGVSTLFRRPYYDYLLNSMKDGVCIFDPQGRYAIVNDVMVKRSGHSRDWFTGKHAFDLIDTTGRKDELQKAFEAVLAGQDGEPVEVRYQSASGQTVWLEVNSSPLVEENRIVGVLSVSRDITEKKKAAEELQLYRNNLEELVEKRTAELSYANEQLQHKILEQKKTEQALRDSEDYYRAIFQNTGTAMVIMEEDTTISLVNRESVKFVGLTPEQLQGRRKAIEFVAPKDAQTVWDYRTRGLNDPHHPPTSYEFTIIDGDGNPKEIFMRSQYFAAKRQMIASFIDITDRKNMERALKESEEKYRNIFENATEGIFQTSLDGKILSANPAFARILGYKSPEYMVKSIKDITSEIYADPGKRAEIRESLRMKGAVNNFEMQCRLPDGTRTWVSMNARVVRDGQGRDLFYEGTLVDITERKKMRQDIEAKSLSLEETNAALRVLLKHREQDNAELEEKVFHNIKDLVLPYVERLKMSRSHDGAIVDIIESNLNDILSPFLKNMTAKYANFTPKEIQIIDLMKKGKTTKEISLILNLSTRTIDIHRYNIRRKLNITNKSINLQSYLLSLA